VVVSVVVVRVVVVRVVFVCFEEADSAVVLLSVFVEERTIDGDAEYIVDDMPAIFFEHVGGEAGHGCGLDTDGDTSEDIKRPSSSTVDA
jgi:hypothetical protein